MKASTKCGALGSPRGYLVLECNSDSIASEIELLLLYISSVLIPMRSIVASAKPEVDRDGGERECHQWPVDNLVLHGRRAVI